MDALHSSGKWLQVAEIASAVPLIGALLLVSLPVWVPLVLHRLLTGASRPDAD